MGELLDRGASRAVQDAGGRTPLLAAAELGDLAVVRLLLGARGGGGGGGAAGRAASLTLRDTRGRTPLLAVSGRVGERN